MCSALRQPFDPAQDRAQDTAWQSKEHGLSTVLRSIVKAHDSVRPLSQSNLQSQLTTETVDAQGNGLAHLMAHQDIKERILRVNGISADGHNHVTDLQARLAGWRRRGDLQNQDPLPHSQVVVGCQSGGDLLMADA